MKFRCKMCDIFSIQHFTRILQTVAKLADPTCIIRITPTRFFIFTKTSTATGGWYISAEVAPDILFDEFQMSGYAADTNEIYVEVNPEVLLRGLRVPSINAKSVKMKLTNRVGPCMCIEAELPSQSSRCRMTVFDVPIIVVHRQVWADITPADELPFDAGCYLPVLKIFKGVIDRMRALGQHHVEISANKTGELKVRIGAPTDSYNVTSHFSKLEISTGADQQPDNAELSERENEEDMDGSNGWAAVVVDLRRLASFLSAQQVPASRTRCDIKHRKYIQLTVGSEELRMRFVLPSFDEGV